jgi:hypothetical protein
MRPLDRVALWPAPLLVELERRVAALVSLGYAKPAATEKAVAQLDPCQPTRGRP